MDEEKCQVTVVPSHVSCFLSTSLLGSHGDEYNQSQMVPSCINCPQLPPNHQIEQKFLFLSNHGLTQGVFMVV